MKSVFLNLFYRQSAVGIIALLAVLAVFNVSPVMGQQTSTNLTGIITSPLNLNVTNITNSATWIIGTYPANYVTYNTKSFYNKNSIFASVGYNFNFTPYPATGTNGWMSSFTNTYYNSFSQAGSINVLSGIGSQNQITPVGYLLISATNIVNQGLLSADIYSTIQLRGSNVDLSYSYIQITALTNSLSFNDNKNQKFYPSTAVYDEFWGQGSQNNVDTSGIWNGFFAASPSFKSSYPCNTGDQIDESVFASGISVVGLTNIVTGSILADSTNIIIGSIQVTVTNINGITTKISVPTNVVQQAVFVSVADSNVFGNIAFSLPSIRTNYYETVEVTLKSLYTNAVTQNILTNFIYLADTVTNTGLFVNTGNPYPSCDLATYRPAGFILSRTDPGFFGLPGSGVPSPVFFTTGVSNTADYYDAGVTNATTSLNNFSGYSAQIDNQGVPLTIAGAVTNLPGNVQISAKNLDLTGASIRAEGEVVINASNLVGSAGALVDCQNVSYNLASSNGFLNVTNMIQPVVSRLTGTVSAWSATWKNTTYIVIPNNYNSSGQLSPLTNSVIVNYYAMVMDASQVASTVPVTVQNLNLDSTNIVVSDPVNVLNSIYFGGVALTLDGNLTLNSTITAWNQSLAPNLLYFTNNATLTIPNTADFGDDKTPNYLAFVNNGTISANTETITSSYYQDSGTDYVTSGYTVNMNTGVITNAMIYEEGQGINFNGNSLVLSNSIIFTLGFLNLNITNSLSDTGGSSTNQVVSDGFNLSSKPLTGSLLGTVFTEVATGGRVNSTWPGTDYGASATGFANNVAMGQLVLAPQGNNKPTFIFAGSSVSNAIYVDRLTLLNGATNRDTSGNPIYLTNSPNLVIYYANAYIGGIQASEKLNHKNNNHLRWVPAYVGTFSSTNIVINGVTNTVNAPLAQSTDIDSDGDGVPNAYDPTPFFTSGQVNLGVTVTNLTPEKALLIWQTIPGATNYIFYKTNLLSSGWMTLTNFITPEAPPYAPIADSLLDTLTGPPNQRYYRVLVNPNSAALYGN